MPFKHFEGVLKTFRVNSAADELRGQEVALVVNTNIASMNAQRSLAHSSLELRSAMERLSTGKKINSAADDAAGFAIAETMTSQVRGLNMAVKNLNDVSSLISVVENSLSDVTDILQRIRELAVQASNGTNSAGDRANLSTEASSLIDEIDRIGSDTTFNGMHLLRGFWIDKSIQVGYNDGDSGSINLTAIKSSTIGRSDGFGVSSPIEELDSADLSSAGVNTVIDLSSYTNVLEDKYVEGQYQKAHENIGHVLNHDNWYGSSWGYGTPDSVHQAQTAFIHFEDGSRYSVETFFPDTDNANANANLVVQVSLDELTAKAGQSWFVSGGGVSAINLSSSPSSALTTIDRALAVMAEGQGAVGAAQNRVGYMISNLMNVAEYTTAARSKIQDADFAVEAARLAKAQVLQQSGTAMLSQANAAPTLVLSLLEVA